MRGLMFRSLLLCTVTTLLIGSLSTGAIARPTSSSEGAPTVTPMKPGKGPLEPPPATRAADTNFVACNSLQDAIMNIRVGTGSITLVITSYGPSGPFVNYFPVGNCSGGPCYSSWRIEPYPGWSIFSVGVQNPSYAEVTRAYCVY